MHLINFKNRSVSKVNSLFPVPLGSIPELPAESCKEIKMNEGGAVSGNFWLDMIGSGHAMQVYCDMDTEGWFPNNNHFLLRDNYNKNNCHLVSPVEKY